jgi:hypothetical protein
MLLVATVPVAPPEVSTGVRAAFATPPRVSPLPALIGDKEAVNVIFAGTAEAPCFFSTMEPPSDAPPVPPRSIIVLALYLVTWLLELVPSHYDLL